MTPDEMSEKAAQALETMASRVRQHGVSGAGVREEGAVICAYALGEVIGYSEDDPDVEKMTWDTSNEDPHAGTVGLYVPLWSYRPTMIERCKHTRTGTRTREELVDIWSYVDPTVEPCECMACQNEGIR